MQYRYIYKITCTAGRFKDKFYFGQHTTDNLDDGYKGSGTLITQYYKKHPNDYIKEIISYHKSQEELNQVEHDIIEPWLNNPMCLNLIGGGKQKGISEEQRKKLSESLKGHTPWNKGKHNIYSEETIEKLRIASYSSPMQSPESRKKAAEKKRGIHCSEETKRKLSEANKGQIPWTKGKSPSEETRQKQRDVMKGRKPYCLGKHRVWNEEHTSYHYE